MLGIIDACLEYANRNLGLTRDVLEQRQYFADGHFARIRRMGVVWPIEKNTDEIRHGSVLAENGVDGWIASRVLKGT